MAAGSIACGVREAPLHSYALHRWQHCVRRARSAATRLFGTWHHNTDWQIRARAWRVLQSPSMVRCRRSSPLDGASSRWQHVVREAQLAQKLPIPKYTHQREIEILSDVIYIHQHMLPAKCYCFAVTETNAAISLERVTNAQLLCLQAERRRQHRRLFHCRFTDRALSSRTLERLQQFAFVRRCSVRINYANI